MYAPATQTLIRPVYHVIALREEGWNIDPQDAPFIEAIETVCCFDRNEITHICSFQGSYALYHVEYRVILTKAGQAAWEGDNADQSVYAMEALVDKYEGTEYEVMDYSNVDDIVALIERITASGEPFRHAVYGDPYPEVADEEYEQYVAEVTESWDCGLGVLVSQALRENSLI